MLRDSYPDREESITTISERKTGEVSRTLIEKTLYSNHPNTIGQLAQQVLLKRDIEEEKFVATVKEMVNDGSIALEAPTYQVENVLDYLLTPTLSGWLWSTMIVCGAAIMSVFIISDIFPFNIVWSVLGSVFVLYLPGYALLRFFFGIRAEMDSLESFALSVGLSLALVPLMGLLLNYLPWGIRLGSIVASLSLLTLTFMIAAATRQYIAVRRQIS